MRNIRKTHAIKWVVLSICAGLASVLLFGFAREIRPQSQPPKQTTERTELHLVTENKSSKSTKEMAKEFVRRAEFYSDGELKITVSYTDDILQEMKKNSNQNSFWLVENNKISQELPHLQTLSLPYIFKDAEYMTSAMNSEKTKNRLDKIFSEKYPMSVECVALGGYVDLVANSSLDLTDFMPTYRIGSQKNIFLEDAHKLLNTQWEDVPWGQGVSQVLEEKTDLAEVTFPEIIAAAEIGGGSKLIALDSGHKQNIVYLLSNINVRESLTKKQKAAIKQASILAAGYSRTLVEEQRTAEREKLDELGVLWFDPNREKYFSMLGEVYRYQEELVVSELDTQLARLIRSDATSLNLN